MASTKNVLSTYQIVTAGSMAANITSTVTSIKYLDTVAFQLNIGSGATGTFDIQSSLDYVQDSQGNVVVPGNWISVKSLFDSITNPAGSASEQLVTSIRALPLEWLRLIYTASSGSGTLNAFITAKSI